MPGFTQKDMDELNSSITTAEDALRWASENLHPRVAKASSFGAEDAVLIDIMLKINPEFRFFTLDTGRLPRETYDTIDRIRKKYGVAVEVVFPDAAEVEEMVNAKGVNLFYESVENRKLCCKVRKVHPINRMLAALDGWITGLRHEQTKLRHAANMFQLDAAHGGIVKINPIINWTWEDVQNYIKSHDVVYNELLDRGYLSIGCEPCTRPVKPGQSLRDGRWWWESGGDLECGIHVDPV
ncbi:MAG: phosphoadenylyl-sulfate reductase [Thaumarchaeota archaeon]|nr:phosphoadenylyl-sulfate reductase [Nitrososphaerota archaeon]MDE0266856.1 phosphoadenylyl-sulfate reductase [Nitrososphaerota archaeon]MDE0526694.1 phosphoadenylyl-sulfate reductase [Nitrososphaerota archaeon]